MRKKKFYLIMFTLLILSVFISIFLVEFPDWLLWVLALIILINVVMDLNEWHKKMVKIAKIIDDDYYKLEVLLDILYHKSIITRADILSETERRNDTVTPFLNKAWFGSGYR